MPREASLEGMAWRSANREFIEYVISTVEQADEDSEEVHPTLRQFANKLARGGWLTPRQQEWCASLMIAHHTGASVAEVVAEAEDEVIEAEVSEDEVSEDEEEESEEETDSTSLLDPVEPATRDDDARGVPNGTFILELNTGRFEFQIYTVSTGRLQGRRIIKYRRRGTYKGFASLMRNGTMRIWPRFRHEQDSSYMVAADLLLNVWRTDDASFDEDRGERMQATIRCRHCNVALYSSTFRNPPQLAISQIHADCARPAVIPPSGAAMSARQFAASVVAERAADRTLGVSSRLSRTPVITADNGYTPPSPNRSEVNPREIQ